MQNSSNLLLLAISGVSRTVQIWSRQIGSCGPWFFGWVFVAGEVLRAIHYQFSVAATGHFDSVPFVVVSSAGVFWLLCHLLARKASEMKGQLFHSYEPGVSYLQAVLPQGHVPSLCLAGDLAVAASLSGLLWLCSSPVQASFYGWTCLWVVIGHGWIELRQHRRIVAFKDRQIETERWSEHISGKQ